MQTEKRKKKVYVPPTFDVLHIRLEENIAIQSPVQKIDVKSWDNEGPDKEENNADIWLNL